MEPLLVGYGTLLNRASLGHSIGANAASDKPLRPVIVEGFRRLFDLRPDHYVPITSCKLGVPGIENAAMNVEPDPTARFNALAFPTTEVELAALDERERYYLRISRPVIDFASGETIGEGHFYAATADAPGIERDPSRLMPLWRDVVWAREGAYAISEAFGRMFDATTFLADGTTRVVDRYADLLGDTSDVPRP